MHLLFKFDIHFYEFFVCLFYEIPHVCTILTISCDYIWLSCILDIRYGRLFSQEHWEGGSTFKFKSLGDINVLVMHNHLLGGS
jgi:hypothetical protein